MITTNLMARGWVHGHFHYELEPHKKVFWDNGREGEIDCKVDFLHNKEWALFPKVCRFAGENLQKGANAHIVARDFWRTETDNGFLNGFHYEVVCLPYYVDLFASGNVGTNKIMENGSGARFENFGEECPWSEFNSTRYLIAVRAGGGKGE